MAISEVEASGLYADARGVRIHYGKVGSGDAVVMLHGGGPGANGWTNFRSNLDDLSKDFTLYVLDLPQFGKSDKPHVAENRLSFWSDCLAAFMADLGLERAHFIGNSMGGQAAIKLAIDRPDVVQSLTVIGPAPVRGSLYEPMPAETIRLIESYYKGAGPSREKMEALARSLVYDQSMITEQLIDERFQDSIAADILELHTKPSPPKQTLDAELHKVECPALIIWGRDDRAAPMDVAFQMLKEFQRGEIHVFAKCGHWAQVEHRDRFNALVGGFMKSYAIG